MAGPRVKDDPDLLTSVKRRAEAMKASREGFDPHYEQLARYGSPRLGQRLLHRGYSAAAAGQEVNNKLMDSYGIRVMNTLSNGMATGMSSPSMPWFKVTVEDTDLRRFKAVKEWLADVETRLYAFFAKTNFYAAMKASYADLGLFGTSATVMVESWMRRAVSHTIPVGDYWTALDEDLVSNTLLRRCDMTAAQMIARFGLERCPQKVRLDHAAGKHSASYLVWHLIEPNGDQVWGSAAGINKPFRSYYWAECGNSRDVPFLSVGGFDERPFWVPRWDVLGNDVYGRSPGMDALPGLRQLQLETLRKTESIDFIRKPAMGAPTALNNTHAALVPGGLTTLANMDKSQFFPLWEVPVQAIAAIRESIQDVKEEIAAVTFADLFMAITNMPGVQPRNVEEIARRNEEKLTQLGPVVDRNQNEQLRVCIDRAFGLLERGGELPQAPEELEGVELKVEFVGMLAQMQKAIGIGPIERVIGFVGSLSAVSQTVIDKIDLDQAVDEYADLIGAPPSIIRSDEQVEKLREGRAQQEAMSQKSEMAPAARDGAMAAKLMSEVQTPPGPGRGGPAAALGLA